MPGDEHIMYNKHETMIENECGMIDPRKNFAFHSSKKL